MYLYGLVKSVAQKIPIYEGRMKWPKVICSVANGQICQNGQIWQFHVDPEARESKR